MEVGIVKRQYNDLLKLLAAGALCLFLERLQRLMIINQYIMDTNQYLMDSSQYSIGYQSIFIGYHSIFIGYQLNFRRNICVITQSAI